MSSFTFAQENELRRLFDRWGDDSRQSTLIRQLQGGTVQSVDGPAMVDFGTVNVGWAGASVKSTASTVLHALGAIPGVVFAFPNQTQGTTEVLQVEAYDYTSTEFKVRARFNTTVPAALSAASLVWMAVA